MQHFLSIQDLSKAEILTLLEHSAKIKKGTWPNLPNKLIATCFFEPSTRTRLSFEAASLRSHAKVLGFSDITGTSISKGESLEDTIHMISSYADLIVMRHPDPTALPCAAQVASIPIINAGNGADEHPSQTLLDLFTIQETQADLEGLTIALAGDLKYSRTIHSLIKVAPLFNWQLLFVAPTQLRFSMDSSLTYVSLEEACHQADILYITRLQKERLSAHEKAITSNWTLKPAYLKHAKANLKILSPLPRQEELPVAIDSFPQAYYFEQAKNGVYVRAALLSALLSS